MIVSAYASDAGSHWVFAFTLVTSGDQERSVLFNNRKSRLMSDETETKKMISAE